MAYHAPSLARRARPHLPRPEVARDAAAIRRALRGSQPTRPEEI